MDTIIKYQASIFVDASNIAPTPDNFKKAIDLDPQYAIAYVKVGWTHLVEWFSGWSQDPQSLDRAFERVTKAISLDDAVEGSRCLLGNIYLWKKQHDKALALFDEPENVNPNYAEVFAELGNLLNFSGRVSCLTVSGIEVRSAPADSICF